MKYIKPQLSYTIWFSQRTDSTLLCKALQSTGVAGKPSEWLNYHNASNLLDKYQLDSHAKLQQRLWKLGTTPNGIFGVKTGACEPYFSNIIDTFKQFPGCDSLSINRTEIWHNAFPCCKHIYMTRRNKIRLAVSWWKAIQSPPLEKLADEISEEWVQRFRKERQQGWHSYW